MTGPLEDVIRRIQKMKVSNNQIQKAHKECFEQSLQTHVDSQKLQLKADGYGHMDLGFVSEHFRDTFKERDKVYLQIAKILNGLLETEEVVDLFSGDGLSPLTLLKAGKLKRATLHDSYDQPRSATCHIGKNLVKKMNLMSRVTFIDSNLTASDIENESRPFLRAPSTATMINSGYFLPENLRRNAPMDDPLAIIPPTEDAEAVHFSSATPPDVNGILSNFNDIFVGQKHLVFADVVPTRKIHMAKSSEGLLSEHVEEVLEDTGYALTSFAVHQSRPIVYGTLKRIS